MTGGPLKPEFTISKCGVLAIFFINGIQLQIGGSEDVKDTMKLNVVIQAYNMLFLPILARLFAGYFPDPLMRDGLMVHTTILLIYYCVHIFISHINIYCRY
jgi:hypothetical protein